MSHWRGKRFQSDYVCVGMMGCTYVRPLVYVCLYAFAFVRKKFVRAGVPTPYETEYTIVIHFITLEKIAVNFYS